MEDPESMEALASGPYIWIIVVVIIFIILIGLYGYQSPCEHDHNGGDVTHGGYNALLGRILFIFILIGFFVAGLILGWRSLVNSFVLGTLMLALFAFAMGWVVTFRYMEDKMIAMVFAVVTVILTIAAVYLTSPVYIDNKSGFARYFPLVMFTLFLLYVLVNFGYSLGKVTQYSKCKQFVENDMDGIDDHMKTMNA